jgi:cytochrome c5
MTHTNTLTTASPAVALLGASFSAQAYDADWKRGRVYYRSVCTSCHTAAPDWLHQPQHQDQGRVGCLLAADKHAKGKDTVSKYVSKDYRASIKATNKAAEKFADTPDKELLDDIKAF